MVGRASWDWDDTAACNERFDGDRRDLARVVSLQSMSVAEAPFDRRALGELGVSGLEFAAFVTQHPRGIASDCVPIRTRDIRTRPDAIYLVDGTNYFLQHDICNPLPFADASLDWVYAEHLIEHVSPRVAIRWLGEVRRVLAPGGLVRLTTPDLEKYARAYLHDDGFFVEHRSRLTRILDKAPVMPDRRAFMLNQIFQMYGHAWIYDEQELRYVLSAAGFALEDIQFWPFGDGKDAELAALDRADRSDETIYAEAVKAGYR